jgi:T-complex protein 1 subunit alpha
MSFVVGGERITGQDVRAENVTAAIAVANVVKSSLGPVGLDKMLVDDMGEVTCTNDGSTILKCLEVEHPAAKVLVELSDLQDQEVGDGPTSVVILAAELLRRANVLVKNQVHPTSVMTGYRLAMKEASKYLRDVLSRPVEALGREALVNVAKTTLSSKLISTDAEFFANLAVDAIQSTRRVDEMGNVRYNENAINILKKAGKSWRDSQLISGFALNCTRSSQSMPTSLGPAKIALVDFNLQQYRAQMGVQVVINDPDQIEAIRQREKDIARDRVKCILDSGANVVLTTKGLDDMAAKYFAERGAIGVRRCKPEDLRRIRDVTGGKIVLSLATIEGDEAFDASNLGEADEVSEVRVADDEMIVIRGGKEHRCQSILLRGPNEHVLEEVERSLHDALCAVRRTLEVGSVVPGGGACEAALSIYLENFAITLGSREQLAIAEFAEALLVIPRTLASNAALDSTDLVAKLRAYHYKAQTDETKRHYSTYGLDLENGKIRDNMEAGVIEPTLRHIKAIQFATEAAITILRIDDMIKIQAPEQHQ